MKTKQKTNLSSLKIKRRLEENMSGNLYNSLYNKGITLIALVVTIVVLLILAGVSINLVLGNNGIITKAKDAKTETEISEVEEAANLIYMDLSLGDTGIIKDVTMADIANKLRSDGYRIEQVVTSVSEITGISIDPSNISVTTGETAKITVTYEGNTTEVDKYYAVISGKYYKMIFEDNGVRLVRTPSDVGSSEDTERLTATSSDTNYVTIEGIEGNIITLKGGSSTGSVTITVKCGSYEKACTVSVIVKPTEDSVADSSVSFSTAYGRIDVIWLNGTSDTVTVKPNAPILTANNESMTPVKWNSSNQVVETTEDDTEWYNYISGSGTADNSSSKWANAKTMNGSYFVWIPRYAYRITYYESQTSTEPTGYYDGYGMWKAEDGKVKYKLESGIETVDYNGEKYIVHPAFQDNLDNGGWSSKLSGFWVAKFEMSGTGTTLKSIYKVSSTKNQYIGTQYTSARQATYGYTGVTDTDGNTSYMYSHMMKNSEWGAVVYLAHSTYGRNGNEIAQNISEVTGDIANVEQSTTGNEYGVYDMSGGSAERMAIFGNRNNSNFSKYGWTTATGLTVDSSSTKYATKYNYDGSGANVGEYIYIVGKTGDAQKEVFSGTSSYAWFDDEQKFVNANSPFLARGDRSTEDSIGTIFASDDCGGGFWYALRTVLCP